jgi:hypothetical protein
MSMRTALLTMVATAVVVAIAFPGLSAGQAATAAKTANSAPAQSPTPVIVELFTSEGCSDCPPADRLLSALGKAQPVPGAEVIPLEEHVDYWNSDGWNDPFSSSQFTVRQKEYVYVFHRASEYTPEMVVDGTVEFVGSDQNRALAAIAKEALGPKADLQIEELPDANSDARKMQLRVSLAPLAALNPKHGAEVVLVVTEDNLASNVTRGENAGKHLNHFGVVRELRVLGKVDSAGSFSATPDLTLARDWKRENLHVVAFVQDRSTKRILGATMLSLSGASS